MFVRQTNDKDTTQNSFFGNSLEGQVATCFIGRFNKNSCRRKNSQSRDEVDQSRQLIDPRIGNNFSVHFHVIQVKNAAANSLVFWKFKTKKNIYCNFDQ